KIPLGYDGWALPFRVGRVRERLSAGKKLSVEDMQRMQQDVTSLPARRCQQILKQWHPANGSPAAQVRDEILAWYAALRVASRPALTDQGWLPKPTTPRSD